MTIQFTRTGELTHTDTQRTNTCSSLEWGKKTKMNQLTQSTQPLWFLLKWAYVVVKCELAIFDSHVQQLWMVHLTFVHLDKCRGILSFWYSLSIQSEQTKYSHEFRLLWLQWSFRSKFKSLLFVAEFTKQWIQPNKNKKSEEEKWENSMHIQKSSESDGPKSLHFYYFEPEQTIAHSWNASFFFSGEWMC